MDSSIQVMDKFGPSALISAATAGRVRHYLNDRSQTVYSDLKGMCERVSDSYRDRVVIELLQNAHDAHDKHAADGQVSISLDPNDGEFGTLTVANFGNGFSELNFLAICSPTMTTKSVSDAIGNKGVGFLSVFQVSAHPEIYSQLPGSSGPSFDGYCFTFADDARVATFLHEIDESDGLIDVLANMPRLYLACPLDEAPSEISALAQSGYATAVRLPLKNQDSLKSVTCQLNALMQGTPPVHLFLSRIGALHVAIRGPEPRSATLTRKPTLLLQADGFRLSEVDCGDQRFLVAERTIPYAVLMDVIHADVGGDRLPASWLKWEGDAIVSLGVMLDSDPVAGRLYNFLPMGGDAHAPFAGYLDAPFYASIDRLKLQPGVDLNDFLLRQCRELAIEVGPKIQQALQPLSAKRAVADMVFWHGPGRNEIRDRLASDTVAIVPAIKARRTGDWATLNEARLWRGDTFFGAAAVARVASFPVVDEAIGPARIERIRSFVSGTDLLSLRGEERADVAEAFAQDLYQHSASVKKWDQYYRSLASQFAYEAALLHGRKLLLTEVGELEQTNGPRQTGGGKRTRLRAVFLPPIRSGDGNSNTTLDRLPLAVQRRITYVSGKLEIAHDGSNPARHFLVTSSLIRDYDTREILRMLAGAIADPGSVKDPDQLRWDALAAMMAIVTDEDCSSSMVAEIGIFVPARSGWIRATEAFFGNWAGTIGQELQDLLEHAAGLSSELDEHATRLLVPYRDWQVPSGAYDNWIAFLRKAGVADHLRPLTAFSGPPPRSEPDGLPFALAQRVSLGDEQTKLWRRRMKSYAALPNPLTPYTATEAYRLPGQGDWRVLEPVVGKLYAKQVVRILDQRSSVMTMTVYRPSSHHSGHKNETKWLSPIGLFVTEMPWISTSRGESALLTEAWLPPADSRSMPPNLKVIEWDLRMLLARCETALATLNRHGLPEYGSKSSAWRFLSIASDLLNAAPDHPTAEQILAAVLEHWQLAPLDATPPLQFKLIARRGGSIISLDMSGEGPMLLVADGDDRQTIAAFARIAPDRALFEPPASRARMIAEYLAQHFPTRIQRASSIQADYVHAGTPIDFDPLDPLVEDELGPVVRDVLVLAHRYRCRFYQGPIDEVLQRLSTLRIRWLDAISLRLGDDAEPVPMFSHRAVLLRKPAGQTLLVAATLRESPRLLFAISEALGEAVGSRKNIGEPLSALTAALELNGHQPAPEDYASVLALPVQEVLGVLGTAKGSTRTMRRVLLPFVYLFAGKEAAIPFGPDGPLVTDDDVAAALDNVGTDLPLHPHELLARAREAGSVENLALSIEADLSALNQILENLGSPYQVIDRTAQHQMTLAAFLSRQSAFIRESFRAQFWSLWRGFGDLELYNVARSAAPLALPHGVGRSQIIITQAELHSWLAKWLSDLGVTPITAMPANKDLIEPIREVNHRLLRAMIPLCRVAALTRGNDALKALWAVEADAQRLLIETANARGWADFGPLDHAAALRWLAIDGWWNVEWGTTFSLDGFGLTQEQVDLVKAEDARVREEASIKRQQIRHSGGVFTIGKDNYAELVDDIATKVSANAQLINTSTRPMRNSNKIVLRSSGSGGGGGKGGGTKPRERKSDEERKLIGFFGEMIAFEWLKKKYGVRRIIDETCWKSLYRTQVFGGVGNDGLGYDFEVGTGRHQWYFEVKATASDDVGDRQVVELGSSEIAKAESCRAEGRFHYRILFVANALQPEHARIFVLHNPRSRQGMAFYTEQETAGVRLHFPIGRD